MCDTRGNWGMCPSFDTKLGSDVAKRGAGELGRKTHRADELGALKRCMMKGRQALWIIYEHLRTSDEAGAIYDLQDLIAAKLKDDDRVEDFLLSWGQGVAGLRKAPEGDLLEPLFFKSKSRILPR